MAPKKAAAKAKPAPKKIIPPVLPAMPAKEGVCGVDGYCCQGKPPEECCGGSCGGSCGCGPKDTLFGCHVLPLLLTGRFWVAALLAAATLSGFDMLWHGRLLMDRYIETSYLWRTEAEMQGLIHLFTVAHLLTGAVFALLLMLLGGGIVRSIKHGVLVAAPMAIGTLFVHVTQPIPTDILYMWAAGSLLQGALVGLVVGAVFYYADNYKKGASCCGGGNCCN